MKTPYQSVITLFALFAHPYLSAAVPAPQASEILDPMPPMMPSSDPTSMPDYGTAQPTTSNVMRVPEITTTSFDVSSTTFSTVYPTETFTPEPSDGNRLTCLRNYAGCLDAHGELNVEACENEALACLDEVPGAQACLRT